MAATRTLRTVAGAARYYPLTAAGSVVFAVGVAFVASGTVLADVYRTSIGLLALAAPLALALAARLQAGRFSEVEAGWSVSPGLVSTMCSPGRHGSLDVAADGIAPWFFFRVHARVRGVGMAGPNLRLHFFDDVASSSAERIRVPLPFPLPGRFDLVGQLEIRDVFGLSKAVFGQATTQPIVVPPAMPRAPQLTRVVTETGGEESTRLRSPEEERYYMREYLPGDRLRDINWKASARVRELFARVSPETQEQSRTLTVYLRNFVAPGQECVEAAVHGAYAAGWMVAFLRTVLREEPGVALRVITARGASMITDEDGVDALSWELAGVPGAPEPAAIEIDRSARQAVVFTTPFDSGLDSFTTVLPKSAMHLFTTQFPGSRAGALFESRDAAVVLFGGSLMPVSATRLRARDRTATRTAPNGTDLIEEVELEMIADRRSYDLRLRAGGSR